MRIGLIADIHSNYEALTSVLSALDKMNVSQIYCLGDVVGYFSQVNECCEELIARNIPCVMGNHDWYMAGGGFCPRSKSVNDCLVYQRKVITKNNLEWLRSFPVQRRFDNVHLLHGGWTDPIDEYLREPAEEYFSKIEGEIFISGHTHIQSLFHFNNNKMYCNPGSVGQPRDNDPRAAFAILENKDITLYRVEYNMQKVFDLMKAAGFDDYYYGSLKTGAKNLCKLPS
jgi:putative phosphoesterase